MADLPPACPAMSGTVFRVDVKRCWADARVGHRVVATTCLMPAVPPLGMCAEHTEELLDV